MGSESQKSNAPPPCADTNSDSTAAVTLVESASVSTWTEYVFNRCDSIVATCSHPPAPTFRHTRYSAIARSGHRSAGLAWNDFDEIEWQFERSGGRRVPVFSAGASARFNILGIFILESYFAYPFQRPDKGWHWGFALEPGGW